MFCFSVPGCGVSRGASGIEGIALAAGGTGRREAATPFLELVFLALVFFELVFFELVFLEVAFFEIAFLRLCGLTNLPSFASGQTSSYPV